MTIFIITMDDPVQTNDFIKRIICRRKNDIVGLAVTKGGRMTLPKGRSKAGYALALLFIMGPLHFVMNGGRTVWFKVQKRLARLKLAPDPSITAHAGRMGIRTFSVSSPNEAGFLGELAKLSPDVVINQSQNILKRRILSIPHIGVLNRHNALLPKNRGRLTPFWVLYKGEKETGVSIHLVNEKIDSGDIVVQERFAVSSRDSFNSLVKKNYEIAPEAMLRALDILETGQHQFIPNRDDEATYNSVPSLRQAIRFRLNRMFS